MSNAPRRPVLALAEAADQSPRLGGLLAQARESARCLDAVLPLIPPALRTAVHPGPLEATEWCIVADGPAAAAKLRQLAPTMLDALQRRGLEVTAIRFRVQSPQNR